MSTRVHRTAVVGPGVELADDVVIGPYAVVLGPSRLSAGVVLGAGAVVGAPPERVDMRQNIAWHGDLEHHGVEIGAGSVIREQATVQQGSEAPTHVGAGCWVLTRAYVAHDCHVGDGATLSAGASLGGHARLGAGATLGMGATVHQRRRVGEGVMVGMSAAVVRDVPPYALVRGVPAGLHGVNRVGMRRTGVSEDDIAVLHELYQRPVVDVMQMPARLLGAWESWLLDNPLEPLLRWTGA